MVFKKKTIADKNKTVVERNAKNASTVTPSMPTFSVAEMKRVENKDLVEIYSASALGDYAEKISSKGARWKCMKLFN